MLPALGDTQRKPLLRVALVACAVSLGLMPVAVRSNRELPEERAIAALAAASLPESATLNDVVVSRDPFSPDLALTSPASVSQRAATGGPPVAVVRALVIGMSPRAIVEVDGGSRVIAPGDKLGRMKVTDIDAAGVHLSNGTVLKLVSVTR